MPAGLIRAFLRPSFSAWKAAGEHLVRHGFEVHDFSLRCLCHGVFSRGFAAPADPLMTANIDLKTYPKKYPCKAKSSSKKTKRSKCENGRLKSTSQKSEDGSAKRSIWRGRSGSQKTSSRPKEAVEDNAVSDKKRNNQTDRFLSKERKFRSSRPVELYVDDDGKIQGRVVGLNKQNISEKSGSENENQVLSVEIKLENEGSKRSGSSATCDKTFQTLVSQKKSKVPMQQKDRPSHAGKERKANKSKSLQKKAGFDSTSNGQSCGAFSK